MGERCSEYGIEISSVDDNVLSILSRMPLGKKPHHSHESGPLRGLRPLATVLADLSAWSCSFQRKEREHAIYLKLCTYLYGVESSARRRQKVLRELDMPSVEAWLEASGGIAIDQKEMLGMPTLTALLEMFAEDHDIELRSVIFLEHDTLSGETRFVYSTAPKAAAPPCVILRKVVRSVLGDYWEGYADLLDPEDESNGSGFASSITTHQSWGDPRFNTEHKTPSQHQCSPGLACRLADLRPSDHDAGSPDHESQMPTLTAMQAAMFTSSPLGQTTGPGTEIISLADVFSNWTFCRQLMHEKKLDEMTFRLASLSAVFTRAFNQFVSSLPEPLTGRMRRFTDDLSTSDPWTEPCWTSYSNVSWSKADQQHYKRVALGQQHELDGCEMDFHWSYEHTLVLPLLIVAPTASDEASQKYSFAVALPAAIASAVTKGAAGGPLLVVWMLETVVLTSLRALRAFKEMELSQHGATITWTFSIGCAKCQEWAKDGLTTSSGLDKAFAARLRDIYEFVKQEQEPGGCGGLKLWEWGALFSPSHE